MNKGQSFNRYEKKYLITAAQREELLPFLYQYMHYDAYSLDRYYDIYNVYFDTDDNNIIRQSVSKPKYKAKLRLRSYQCPLDKSDTVFLEIKKKIEGKVTKRRVILSYEDALAFLKNRHRPEALDYMSTQVLNEIEYYLSKNEVKPNYYIAYRRKALVDPNSALRITIDDKITVRTYDVNLDSDIGRSLLEKDQYLIEIKAEDNFPLWLTRKLSSMNLYARSFSKYGHAYKMNIIGDEL